jgi:hypothetical protein
MKLLLARQSERDYCTSLVNTRYLRGHDTDFAQNL